MGKFDITEFLSSKSMEQHSEIKAPPEMELIDIDKIRPNPKNPYSVDDVQDLIDSISMVGLEQNLVIYRSPKHNSYVIISGHRRYKALRHLVDEGREEFRMVPCKVSHESGPINDILIELRLIFGNSTARKLSDYEQTQQVIRMKELLRALKDNGIKIPGKLQTLIADTLKTSKSKVGRMENIAGNLALEFQEEFKSGGINMSVANELSGLPQDQQHAAYERYKEKGSITVREVKQRKTTTRIEAPAPPPPPLTQETVSVEKPLICAECGLVIEGEWYKCLDNCMQARHFVKKDKSDNVFCSKECFCENLSLELMTGGDNP